MRLSYVQLDEQFLVRDSLIISALTSTDDAAVIGYGSKLFKFAVEYTATATKPPDGIILDPNFDAEGGIENDAGFVLERVMGWRGPHGKLIGAFIAADVVVRIAGGLRVRGMRRYLGLWRKSYPEAAKALAQKSSVTVTEPEKNRDGPVSVPDPQIKIEIKNKALKPPTPFSGEAAAPPVGQESLELVSQEPKRPKPEDVVMAHYLEAMKANGIRARDSPSGRKLITDRLTGRKKTDPRRWSVEDCLEAINGLTWSDHHMQGGFTGIKYALRSSDQMEMMLTKKRGAA